MHAAYNYGTTLSSGQICLLTFLFNHVMRRLRFLTALFRNMLGFFKEVLVVKEHGVDLVKFMKKWKTWMQTTLIMTQIKR